MLPRPALLRFPLLTVPRSCPLAVAGDWPQLTRPGTYEIRYVGPEDKVERSRTVVVETSECLTCTLPTKSATRLSNPTYYARDSVEDQYIMPVMCFLCCIVMYTLGTKHATAEFKTTAQTAAGSGSGRPSVSIKPQPREGPDSVAKTDVQKPTTPMSAAQPSLETVLPPGWVPVRSNTTGAVFWYNKFSRESSWTPPLAAGVSAPKSPAVCFAKADPVAGQVVPTDQALCATMRIVVVRKDTNRIVEAGSGVGVDSRGLVLTACHVVKHAFADPTKYTVLLAPTESVLPGAAAPAMCPVGARSPVWELSARVVAASCNPALDIALLQVVAVVKTEPRSGLFASSDPSPRTKQEMHRSITVSELRGWNCADAAAPSLVPPRLRPAGTWQAAGSVWVPGERSQHPHRPLHKLLRVRRLQRRRVSQCVHQVQREHRRRVQRRTVHRHHAAARGLRCVSVGRRDRILLDGGHEPARQLVHDHAVPVAGPHSVLR